MKFNLAILIIALASTAAAIVPEDLAQSVIRNSKSIRDRQCNGDRFAWRAVNALAADYISKGLNCLVTIETFKLFGDGVYLPSFFFPFDSNALALCESYDMGR